MGHVFKIKVIVAILDSMSNVLCRCKAFSLTKIVTSKELFNSVFAYQEKYFKKEVYFCIRNAARPLSWYSKFAISVGLTGCHVLDA